MSDEDRDRLPDAEDLPPLDQIRGTREELEMICKHLGKGIKKEMDDLSSGRPMGFCIWLFDFGADGHLAYVSNANREDVLRLMREHVKRLERRN